MSEKGKKEKRKPRHGDTTTRGYGEESTPRVTYSSSHRVLTFFRVNFLLFMAPVLAAVALFIVLDFSNLQSREAVSGEMKLLYTSDVGGAIDPCG